MLFARRAMYTLGVAGLVAGCAGRTASSLDATANLSSGTLVMSQELAAITQQGTLMDALQRLRPAWLRSRGASPMVSIDGGAAMELSSLRLISASIVREVRLERSTFGAGRAAVGPNGDVIVGNVIVVTTGQRSREER